MTNSNCFVGLGANQKYSISCDLRKKMHKRHRCCLLSQINMFLKQNLEILKHATYVYILNCNYAFNEYVHSVKNVHFLN